MKYYVIRLDTDGSITTVETEKSPGLKFLYEQIGCSLIESVNLWDDYIMLVDEEGWWKENPVPNKNASYLYSVSPSSIVGNAVVLKRTRCDWKAFSETEIKRALTDIKMDLSISCYLREGRS